MYRVISSTGLPCEEQGDAILVTEHFYRSTAEFEAMLRRERGHTHIVVTNGANHVRDGSDDRNVDNAALVGSVSSSGGV